MRFTGSQKNVHNIQSKGNHAEHDCLLIVQTPFASAKQVKRIQVLLALTKIRVKHYLCGHALQILASERTYSVKLKIFFALYS
jgi:hypothetical protein